MLLLFYIIPEKKNNTICEENEWTNVGFCMMQKKLRYCKQSELAINIVGKCLCCNFNIFFFHYIKLLVVHKLKCSGGEKWGLAKKKWLQESVRFCWNQFIFVISSLKILLSVLYTNLFINLKKNPLFVLHIYVL